MWKVTFPNMPTFVINLLIFILSVCMMIYAIDNHNMTLGVISLIFNMIELKLDYKNLK